MIANRHAQSDTGRRLRRGITFIEILIVMGIIVLLATFALTSIVPILTGARETATRATLATINDAIQQRIDAINRLDLTSEAKRFAVRASMNQQQAEFIIRKNLYRQALPQRIEDLWGLDRNVSTVADNAPQLTDWPNRPTSPPTASDTEHSSMVLFWALTEESQIRVTSDGKAFNVPTLRIDDVNPNHLADSDLDGQPDLFVDDWDQPLQFYNFATRLIRPDGVNPSPPPLLNPITQAQRQTAETLVSGLPSFTGTLNYQNGTTLVPHPLNTDPDDPVGTLAADFSSTFNVMIQGVGTITANAFTEATYHTPNTLTVPLLVSSGPDTALGLTLPTATGSTRHAQPPTTPEGLNELTDNITNRQQ